MKALIVGGGVAGLATASWLARYEAPFDWVADSGEFGGILRTVYNPIIDYPGVSGDTGDDVADAIGAWSSNLVKPPSAGRVDRIERAGDRFRVTVDGEHCDYDIVVIATGTRRRTLGVPGESEGLGDFILLSTSRNPARFQGRPVAIIGGADAAVEGSLNLADAGASEVVIVRRSSLRAQRHFVQQMREHDRIRVYDGLVEATRFERLDGGCRVHLDDGAHLDVAAAFVRIGVEPVVPDLGFDLETSSGFIIADSRCKTSVDRLYAVGDVLDTPLRSVATCVGDGARAGRAVAEELGVWTDGSRST